MKHLRKGTTYHAQRRNNAKRSQTQPSSLVIAQRLLVIIVCCVSILQFTSHYEWRIKAIGTDCTAPAGSSESCGGDAFQPARSSTSSETRSSFSTLQQSHAVSEMDKGISNKTQITQEAAIYDGASLENEADDEELSEWLWKSPRPIAWTDHSNFSFVEKRHSCIRSIRQKQQKLFHEVIFQGQDYESIQEIALVDPAMHINVGDNMLTAAAWLLIQKNLRRKDFKQCHIFQALKMFPKCADVLSTRNDTSKVALWHAGGNWGDLYRYTHRPRINSFELILKRNYRIVGLPQSLYYKNKATKNQDTLRIKQKIAQGLGLADPSALDVDQGTRLGLSQVTFFWREKESLAEAQQLYPYATNLLSPDIAFLLGPFAPIRKHPEKLVDVLLFLRKDRESKVNSIRNDEAVRGLLTDKDITFRIVDWDDQQGLFGKEGESHFTEEAIQLISLGKVVICDRLHASILSYLSGLPFVYIDQVTLKLTKTLGAAFEGIEDCQDREASLWAKASSLEEALVKASELINLHDLDHNRGYLS